MSLRHVSSSIGPRAAFCAAALLATLSLSSAAEAADVNVSDANQLASAIQNAQAGDTIILAAGTYAVGDNLRCNGVGTATEPIVVRAGQLGDATIEFDAVEGFVVAGPYWRFENLVLRGVCGNDSNCEHAWHVVGEADNTVISNNRAVNFNAQIKGNGQGDPRVWPDDVVVEFNEFYNDAPRNTSNPVTPIDVVGGRRWIIRSNYIHDFAKGGGNNISYAAFLKGNSRDGLFERNLVRCSALHSGQVRLGLSFGGGGSAPDPICEDGTCTPEHQNGVMRNNIIMDCNDVGIYVNKGQNVSLFNNTLYNTTGIDVRFDSSTANVTNNILTGNVRERNGGTITQNVSNLLQVSTGDFDAWFADPAMADFQLVDGSAFVNQGTNLVGVTDDYCVVARDDGMHDIGAVEYVGGLACNTAFPPMGSNPPIMMDMAGDMGRPDMTGDVDTDMPTGDAGSDASDTGGDTTTPGDVTQDSSTDGPGGDVADGAGGGDDGCGCTSVHRPQPTQWPVALLLIGCVGLLSLRRRERAPR